MNRLVRNRTTKAAIEKGEQVNPLSYMGLHPTPIRNTTLPKKVTAGHREKFLPCSSLTPLPDTRG